MTWCFSTRASVTTVLTTHPCISWCLRVKKNMHLPSILFIHTLMTQSVEILPGGSQGPTYITLSMTFVPMTWWRKEPGHHQPQYRQSFPGVFPTESALIIVCKIEPKGVIRMMWPCNIEKNSSQVHHNYQTVNILHQHSATDREYTWVQVRSLKQ